MADVALLLPALEVQVVRLQPITVPVVTVSPYPSQAALPAQIHVGPDPPADTTKLWLDTSQ